MSAEAIPLPKKTVAQATVLEHRTLGHLVKWLTLEAPAIAQAAKPGQFVHVRVADSHHPLLRRPISIAAANAAKGTIILVYRIVGHGTALLAKLEPGATVDLMGPLGSGFAISGERPLLVGGGMGLAPLVYLAKELCPRPVTVVMGGRTRADMYWENIFHSICANMHITTDDGSLGRQGFAVDLLPEVLAGGNYDSLYTCGPKPLMEATARLAKQHGIPCQVSLEDHMACGVGACLSCTCAGTDGVRRKVCTDGPVFEAGEVLEL
jgi:dihydroorotate dehydrogenase electron transfer subunit